MIAWGFVKCVWPLGKGARCCAGLDRFVFVAAWAVGKLAGLGDKDGGAQPALLGVRRQSDAYEGVLDECRRHDHNVCEY